jgi:urease accessory protein
MAAVPLKNFEWLANLELKLSRNNRGSVLSHNRHSGPLYVQKPFYPEGRERAHIYLLHPPGGVVSGDELNIQISLEENAQGLITTPGAARLYKARQNAPLQQQHVNLRVGNGAVLEWFPMETILYNQSDAKLTTTIQLNDSARFMGWEITCFGLPAADEPFTQGKFCQNYRIEKNNIPLFVDKLSYDSDKVNDVDLLKNQAGLQSHAVTGFFIAGQFDFDRTDKENLTEALRSTIAGNGLEHSMAVTWVNHFCLVRYLGKSAYKARQGFILLWHHLRPALISQQACEPRIWFT